MKVINWTFSFCVFAFDQYFATNCMHFFLFYIRTCMCSLVHVGGKCLAKYTDELWHPAIIRYDTMM